MILILYDVKLKTFDDVILIHQFSPFSDMLKTKQPINPEWNNRRWQPHESVSCLDWNTETISTAVMTHHFFFLFFVVTPPLIVLLCFLCVTPSSRPSVWCLARPDHITGLRTCSNRWWITGGDKGRGGGERAADHEAQLCSESFMSLSGSTRKTFSCNKPL